MDWRLKCLAFHILQRIAGGARIYAALQEHVTKNRFATISPEKLSVYSLPARMCRGGIAVEFGAGSNLLAPLLLSAAGAARVIAYDVARIATVAQINHVIRQLRKLIPGDWTELTTLDELERYRIDYRAPAEFCVNNLPAHSVDLIYSTSTLEHVPPEEIRAILRESRRILKAEGQLSFVIDYHDHYAQADPRITQLNFYRFSDWQWRFYSPRWHFQNRLRHGDYVQLFEAAGFHVDGERTLFATEKEMVPLHKRFALYPREDLLTMQGRFVLHA